MSDWFKSLPTCGCSSEQAAGEAAITAIGFDPWNPVQADGVELTCAHCKRAWPATQDNLVAMREYHARSIVRSLGRR